VNSELSSKVENQEISAGKRAPATQEGGPCGQAYGDFKIPVPESSQFTVLAFTCFCFSFKTTSSFSFDLLDVWCEVLQHGVVGHRQRYCDGVQGKIVKMADNRLRVVGRLTDVVECRRHQVVASVPKIAQHLFPYLKTNIHSTCYQIYVQGGPRNTPTV
jgi:hypothetical protein